MDERTIATIKWGAIALGVYTVITIVSGYIASSSGVLLISSGTFIFARFRLSSLISSFIWSVIGGAVGGAIFAYTFYFWLKLAKAIFGWLFNFQNIFQLLFYPSVVFFCLIMVFNLLSMIMGGLSFAPTPFSVMIGMIFWLINFIGGIVGIYALAAIMEHGIGKYYDSIINSGGAQ